MAKKQEKNNNVNILKGAGTKYHEEHASHTPDYGANTVDPNANQISNMTEKNQ